jgi:hypothetical protein
MNSVEKFRYAVGFAIVNFLGLGVLPNLASEYVKVYYVSALVAVLLLVLFYVFLDLVARKATKNARTGIEMVQSENPSHRKGLIVFSSPGLRTTAAENAIKAHLGNLQHCWIIAGPDSPGAKPTSRQNAEQLIQTYGALKPAVAFYIKGLDDEHNPGRAFHLVQAIYHEAFAHGLAEGDIVADYTGGTKSMTAGMVLACSVSEERNAQYMKPRRVEPTGIATPAAEAVPILVDLRFGAKG